MGKVGVTPLSCRLVGIRSRVGAVVALGVAVGSIGVLADGATRGTMRALALDAVDRAGLGSGSGWAVRVGFGGDAIGAEAVSTGA